MRNFGQVDGTIYRGAAPSEAALRDLAALHVKLVLDLREKGAETDREKAEVEQLGMLYRNVPFRPLSAPTPAQIQTVLTLLSNGNAAPVFVHCRRGKDRTGTVLACYRIQHDGWTGARALQEANSYGMSYVEHGMRSFILHFSALMPVAAPPLAPAH
ncbi:MAG TPA: tyrosine-protein phosphatase [Bryobacteraceae bacterium]|nr:tyrosine-protein phosphatase [Bryobacteraceae bacterium]